MERTNKGVGKVSYLTDDEKRMEFNMRKAQYFLGMQCSLNKGDGKELKELLNELIDDTLQEGRKQGALKTYKNVLDKANRTVWDNNDWQLYTRRKIKELEEGSTKVCDFLESSRKKLGDVEK